MQTIKVKDHGDIIEIGYADLLKYHGNQMLGGVALAFQIMRLTFPLLCETIPERGQFYFYSGIGQNGQGIMDAAEMVMRVKTHGQLRLDLAYSEDKPGQIAPGGGRYYFEIGYQQKKLALYLKEGVIPEEFITYSKLAHRCKQENIPMKAEDQERLLALRKQLAKSILDADPKALLSFAAPV